MMPLDAEYVRKIADGLSEHCNEYPANSSLRQRCNEAVTALHRYAHELAFQRYALDARPKEDE
jgi:hypothetical protein